MTEGALTKELEQVGVQTYLKISSKGEIEPESFRLIGASTKRDDDESIGIFGSGLKYSIAYLLRNKINFWVFSGTREVKFETKTANFRGKQFEQIYIDGEATSFTTDLGYDWELWWSIREIYCNAIDEGGYSCEETASFDSTEGETAFYIEVNKGVKEILDNWGRYFAEGRKDLLYSKGGVKLNKGLEFLNECEHPIQYPITIVDFKEPEVKGSCGDENIYVGRSALNSVHLTIKVLIEENEHLKTGYSDCTRAFQDHFLELFVNEKTKRFSYPI